MYLDSMFGTNQSCGACGPLPYSTLCKHFKFQLSDKQLVYTGCENALPRNHSQSNVFEVLDQWGSTVGMDFSAQRCDHIIEILAKFTENKTKFCG